MARSPRLTVQIPEPPLLGRERLLYLPNNEGGRYIYAKRPPGTVERQKGTTYSLLRREGAQVKMEETRGTPWKRDRASIVVLCAVYRGKEGPR